jgi:hypothetical protein
MNKAAQFVMKPAFTVVPCTRHRFRSHNPYRHDSFQHFQTEIGRKAAAQCDLARAMEEGRVTLWSVFSIDQVAAASAATTNLNAASAFNHGYLLKEATERQRFLLCRRGSPKARSQQKGPVT